ncbi:hypothetical protein NPS01_34630 [Nocardioides psychrotolerans]|nr:hypothetical protein NPS01_34630 [Nocardioides psychrotolerans]
MIPVMNARLGTSILSWSKSGSREDSAQASGTVGPVDKPGVRRVLAVALVGYLVAPAYDVHIMDRLSDR